LGTDFKNLKLPSNRTFGLFFSLIFVLIAIYFTYIELLNYSIVFYILSFVFIIISFLKSEILLPLNKMWMKLGLLIGSIVSPIVLGGIFFILFTPVAILFKITKRDELRLNFKRRSTYWVKREGPIESESFKNQF
jgi:hypothetical protein